MDPEEQKTQTIFVQNETNGAAVTSLVLGITGAVIGFIPYIGWFMAPVWLLAIVFGIVGMRKKYKRGMAITGTIFGFFGALYKIGFWIFITGGFLFLSSQESNSTISNYETPNSEVSSTNDNTSSDTHSSKETVEEAPTPSPETIALLDDPNYQNNVLPEELNSLLTSEEDVLVYFYSPTCPECLATTPTLMSMASENELEIVQYNLLEYEQGWDDYKIETMPALLHFKNGEVVSKLEGKQSEEQIALFMEQYDISSKSANEFVVRDMDTGDDIEIINGRKEQIFLYVYFSYREHNPDEPSTMDILHRDIEQLFEKGIEVVGLIHEETSLEEKNLMKTHLPDLPIYLDKDESFSKKHSIFFTPEITVEDGLGNTITNISGSSLFEDRIDSNDIIGEVIDKVNLYR